MPELRRDPIIGRWIIVAKERAKRPQDFKHETEERFESECPFCEGNESKTPPEIYAIRENGANPNTPGWKTRVVPSISPILRIEGEMDRKGSGIYDMMNGIGAHELIIESPKHYITMGDIPAEEICCAVKTYAERIKDLGLDDRFKYVLLYKNHG